MEISLTRWEAKKENLERNTKFALIYPNSYYLGMSNLGFQSIYYELNRRPDTSCIRVFFEHQAQLSFANFETQYDLRKFDILGFSISFENDYFNIPKILNLAKIPPKGLQRDEGYPLVIAGGISVSYNPEPLADFLDAFVIGEAEINIHNFLSAYNAWKGRHIPNLTSAKNNARLRLSARNNGRLRLTDFTPKLRQELLENLAQLDGIYVPSLYNTEYNSDGTIKNFQNRNGTLSKIKAGIIPNIDDIETSSKILTDNTEFSNTYLIEISRGCGRQCRFCIADYTRRPPRYRSVKSIIQLAKQAKGYTTRIGLLGAAVSDHPHIDEIAQNLVALKFRISCASLRVETVSPALLNALAESGQNTITIAPEVATERLQKVINKPIDVAQLHYVFEEALKRDIANIKLYFMIGVPSETPADIEAIVELVSTLRSIMLPYAKKRGRIGRLICSISPFVPKPHTPLQWSQMEDVKIISRKLNFLKRQLNQLGSVHVASASARLANIEGVLARGDRRLGSVIYEVAINGLSWNKALRKYGIDANFYTQRERASNETLPWGHINLGVNPEYLQLEYTKSRREILTSQCQASVCKKCGTCR